MSLPATSGTALVPDQFPSQLDKFKEAARQLGTDDDPERIEKLVKHKPVPEKTE